MTAHRSTMKCLHAIAVLAVRVEATCEHRFENFRFTAFRRSLHHQMMLRAKLAAQIWILFKQRFRERFVAGGASRDKAIQRGEFVLRPMLEKPSRHVVISMQVCQSVCRASIGTGLVYVCSVRDQ